MDIITGITTAISTLKTGYEIKKLAGNLDSEVQQSELRVEIRKLQESLIEVQDILINAKREILDQREIIQEKDAEIKQLKELLNSKNSPHTIELSDDFIKILKVFNQDENITASSIARNLGLSEQKVEYFLDGLIEKELITHSLSFSLSEGAFYLLTKEGRRFMFENDLL